MKLKYLTVGILLAPQLVRAQRVEIAWALGTSVATTPVVERNGNIGKLQPALLVEVAANVRDQRTRRFGAVVQAVPMPTLRVKGKNLEGEDVARSFNAIPLLVVRAMADLAPWRTDVVIAPSFGLGYTAYVHPPSGCVSGNDSPLCFTAASIHGAAGPTGHMSAVVGGPASRWSAHVRYLVTRARNLTTQDVTVAVRWRRPR